MELGFELTKVVDNNKAWLSNSDKIRVSNSSDYNAYYFVDNEKLVLNAKNIDLFMNPSQGILYDIWNQSVNYDYPIPESGYTIDYPVPGGVEPTYYKPNPKTKTFFEFSQTFFENTINVRNRQTSSDGKTGGYPNLQSIFWKYLESNNTVGIPNNRYTYQKLIDYVDGIGPYWTKLVEQMIPASTIWNSGIRLENSILNRQKFVYRRQSGCQFIPVQVQPCELITDIFSVNCSTEFAEFNIFAWLNGDITVSNFDSVLVNRVNYMLAQSGLTLNDCVQNSISTTWYVDFRVDNVVLIQEPFYNGITLSDSPTTEEWRNALIEYLPLIHNYGYTYTLNGNQLTVTDLTCNANNSIDTVYLNVGININIDCN
jgi:hypothetical protein